MPIRAPMNLISEARETDFAVENNICRPNIGKSPSKALKNENN